MQDYRAKMQDALARKRVTDKLTPKERIARLDTILGVGQGAKRERARLAKLAAAPVPAPKTKTKKA